MGNYEHPKLSQQKQNQAEAKERKQDGLFENRKKGLFSLDKLPHQSDSTIDYTDGFLTI